MSNGYSVIPKLVEDDSLKRARVDNGDGTYSIRTVGSGGGGGSTDVSAIEAVLGTTADTTSDNTLSGKERKIRDDTAALNTNVGTLTDAPWDGTTTSASVISLLKGIYNTF